MKIDDQQEVLKPVSDLTFEEALDELDMLVRRMEAGQLGLDASVECYQRAVSLAGWCQGRLAIAEQKISTLESDSLKPLEPSVLRNMDLA